MTSIAENCGKPTILIIQGAFQTPRVYEQLLQALLSKGYPTLHPPLPSCSNVESSSFPLVSLADDALVIENTISQLVEKEGKTVFVVMHSYGGLVGTEAIPKNLTYNKRSRLELTGGVLHLFFFSAFMLDKGQSVLGAFGESPNNEIKDDGRYWIRNGAQLLYNDLPDAEAKYWESQLIPHSHAVESSVLTRTSWRYIPSTYLICDGDKAAPPAYQEMFATNANSDVERCDSDHSPMLSQPGMLVGKIVGALERAIEKAGKGI